jgi:4-alpha-glucanotransferase
MPRHRTKPRFTFSQRAAGVLLHPTSLPGPHGCGDLGSAAHRFVDFLWAAGQRWWQMLPVGPTPDNGAPYSAYSAFAGNPLLISLDLLARDGLLTRAELTPERTLSAGRVDFPATIAFRTDRLRRAHARFARAGGFAGPAFASFVTAAAAWLAPYALFCALRGAHHGRPWTNWNTAPVAVSQNRALRDEFSFTLFAQFVFGQQWNALRRYARARGVGLMGDIPIFVAHESCDVWAHPHLFDLDAAGRPRTVSGVPPDSFSKTGQLWSHPHYRWDQHRATGFAWWLARFERLFTLFDAASIDHFLGFNRVWAVPGRARTAQHGRWVKVPGTELFAALRHKLGSPPIIAEDLGLLTPQAVALRDRFGFPGMRILQFAFDDEGGRYHQPHTYLQRCVVYPGTHDNETTVGWFERLRRKDRRRRRKGQITPYQRVLRYLGTTGREIHWDFIRLALASPADTAIVPVQDLLGLGNEARMNLPATVKGNWQWRLLPGQLTPRIAARLRDLAAAYGRLHAP